MEGDFAWGFDGDDESDLSENNAGIVEAYSHSYTADELIMLFNRAVTEGGQDINSGELIEAFNKLVNYQGASYYEIPANPERYGKRNKEELQAIVSNYLALLSGSIKAYANDALEPTAIKTTIQLRTVGQDDTERVVSAIKTYINAHFPSNVKTLVGGTALVESSLNTLVVDSQLKSLAISLCIVFLIIALSNHSLAAGLFGIVPLVISILIKFAVMGFLRIKLNIGTSMVASLAVGIGIDYTIHFIETYKMEYRNGCGDYLRRTFLTAGMAIIINAVSVGMGFAVLMLSQFIILRDLGLLIALTMAVSALVSLTVIPALLTIIKPKFIFKEMIK
jgi:predicted RND superfamily exporter protein